MMLTDVEIVSIVGTFARMENLHSGQNALWMNP